MAGWSEAVGASYTTNEAIPSMWKCEKVKVEKSCERVKVGNQCESVKELGIYEGVAWKCESLAGAFIQGLMQICYARIKMPRFSGASIFLQNQELSNLKAFYDQ